MKWNKLKITRKHLKATSNEDAFAMHFKQMWNTDTNKPTKILAVPHLQVELTFLIYRTWCQIRNCPTSLWERRRSSALKLSAGHFHYETSMRLPGRVTLIEFWKCFHSKKCSVREIIARWVPDISLNRLGKVRRTLNWTHLLQYGWWNEWHEFTKSFHENNNHSFNGFNIIDQLMDLSSATNVCPLILQSTVFFPPYWRALLC